MGEKNGFLKPKVFPDLKYRLSSINVWSFAFAEILF